MITKNTLNSVAPAIKRIAMVHKDGVDINECETIEEMLNAARVFPLDLLLIAQTDTSDSIERHFLVGLALPVKNDKFKLPLMYYVSINPSDYEKVKTFTEKYKTDKNAIWVPDSKIVH